MATLDELRQKLATAKNQVNIDAINAEITKLELQQQSAQGDKVANMMLALNQVIDNMRLAKMGGAGINRQDAENLVKDILKQNRVGLGDLSDEIQNYLKSAAKVSLQIQTPTFSGAGGKISQATLDDPLFQKILSDGVAMNNVYLFGGAGVGKTFIAREIANFLNWELITIPCSQFTSPLEILGGQTIDGYQLGKLERAWGNLDMKGQASKFGGALLLIDEMPKIDPNTAGLLNDALAKVKDYDAYGAPVIENGRGEKIIKKNLLVIATGNVKLNETSTEYEANFKQDLSLQDRFAGSTYEITVNYSKEFYQIMKGFAFIWIPLTKLREKIFEMRYQGQAFVSIRLMTNLKATYIEYRKLKSGDLTNIIGQPVTDAIKSPKTLKQGVDSFLNLFKPDQIDILKQAMEYDKFILEVEAKNLLPLDELDTPEELKEGKEMVKKYTEIQKKKIA